MQYDRSDSRDISEIGQETGFRKEDMREAEELTKNDVASDRFTKDQDPLIDSVITLRALQEALEEEVQKFEEVGKNFTSLLYHPSDDECVPQDIAELNSMAQMSSERVTNALSSVKAQGPSPTEDVKLLEVKLGHVKDMLKKKESRISELEATLDFVNSRKEECGSAVDLNRENCGNIEIEQECLFRQRIEFEVEYLAITMTIQTLRLAAGDELNSLDRKQEQSMLETAKSKVRMLEKKMVKLKTYRENITETENILKTQWKVCKATACFLMQLSLLMYIWLFFWQINSGSKVIVPT